MQPSVPAPGAPTATTSPLPVPRVQCTNCGLIQAVRSGSAACPSCGNAEFTQVRRDG